MGKIVKINVAIIGVGSSILNLKKSKEDDVETSLYPKYVKIPINKI